MKLEEEALRESFNKMAAVEEDPKEYRWETGYEKVFSFCYSTMMVGHVM